MICLSVLLYIPINIMEFIHLSLIKFTSCPVLVSTDTVIDPEPEGLDTYRHIVREWNIAWLE